MEPSTDPAQTEPLLILPETPELTFPTQDQEDLAVISEGIRTCPEFFYHDLLGDTLDEQQIPVVHSVQENRRTTVKSGHSCGKDYLAAREALRFHLSYYPSRVLITAPTGRQANEIVWSEFMRAYHTINKKIPVGGRLLESGELKYPGSELEDIHNVICFSTDEANALTGFHAENVLVIVSEAQGLNAKLWRAIKSLLTGTGVVRLLLIGNAVPDLGGEFYQSFGKNRALYKCITLDSRKSSHCSGEFIEDIVEEYGLLSPMFEMMVAGNFPKDGQDTLISIADIERGQRNWSRVKPGPTNRMGVDVGDQGSDETVFIERRGERFVTTHSVQGDDTEVTGAKLKKRIEDSKVGHKAVAVDTTGIGNAVFSYLKHRNIHVHGVNFSATPKGPGAKFYKNKRAEMFFHLKKQFKDGSIAIDPEDTKLAQELSVLRYKVNPADGLLQIVKKEDIKKLLGRSPDRADALALCAYGKTFQAPRLTSGEGTVKGKGAKRPSLGDYREKSLERIRGNRRRKL